MVEDDGTVEFVDIETLLKPRLEEHDFEIKGVGMVRVRALSRAEVLRLQKGGEKIDLQVVERKMLTAAMVNPTMTEAQVGQWQKACPGGEVTKLTEFISSLSGLQINAEKEAYLDFEEDPEAEFPVPAGE